MRQKNGGYEGNYIANGLFCKTSHRSGCHFDGCLFFEISNHFFKRVALVTNPKTLTIVSHILGDYNQNQR